MVVARNYANQPADVRVAPFLRITHPESDYLVIIRLRPPLFSDIGIEWRIPNAITNGLEFKGKENLTPRMSTCFLHENNWVTRL